MHLQLRFAWIILCLGWWLTPAHAFSGEDHDIHVCLTELRYNESSRAFEVAIKIFIDDLELALQKEQITGLHIGSSKEVATADDHIRKYIDQHFSIIQDGKKLAAQFIGKEVAEDLIAIWCYIEYPAIPSPKKCVVTNDVLFEMYDDQRNIMDIRMSSTHKAFTLFEPGRSSWEYSY